MRPADWLLLYLAARPAAVDPVRTQKGLFVLAMQGGLPIAERYRFEPYAYGPMSRGLYHDVRELERARLLETRPAAGQRWSVHAVTPAGAARARRLRAHAPGRPLALVERTRDAFDALTFSELLSTVYDRYPEYAVRSVFRRP